MDRYAIQQIDLETRVVVLETYRQSHRLHRDSTEGPAYIRREPQTGIVLEERYYRHGRYHRDDGPAVVRYSAVNSVPFYEMYYHDGLMHRDPKEGPARIERNWDGSLVLIESYYVYGHPYRDPADGPNHRERREDGSIDCEYYSESNERRPSRKRGPLVSRHRSKSAPSP
jgi:hypothetical protein